MLGKLKQCPLCKHPLPWGSLHKHIEKETQDIREYAIKLIRAQHPDWTAEDGTCKKCWEYYKKL